MRAIKIKGDYLKILEKLENEEIGVVLRAIIEKIKDEYYILPEHNEEVTRAYYELIDITEPPKTYTKTMLYNETRPLNTDDTPYFYIARAFLFTYIEKHGKTKSLIEADYNDWIDTARKLIINDKRPLRQIIAIKLFFDSAINKEYGADDFWITNTQSISSLRKKNKDGVYYYDMIAKQAKKWLDIEGNSQKVYEAENRYNKMIENAIKTK